MPKIINDENFEKGRRSPESTGQSLVGWFFVSHGDEAGEGPIYRRFFFVKPICKSIHINNLCLSVQI